MHDHAQWLVPELQLVLPGGTQGVVRHGAQHDPTPTAERAHATSRRLVFIPNLSFFINWEDTEVVTAVDDLGVEC